MIFTLLPLFFYFYSDLIERRKHFIPTVAMIVLMTSTHVMLSAMCAIIFCIYGFFAGLKKQTWYLGFVAFVTGFFTAGIVLLPALTGGLASDTSQAAINTMKDWSQSIFTSLSVTNRTDTVCSFGFSVLFMAIFTLIFGKKKCGTIISLIFFLLTSDIFLPLLIQMPLSQALWMSRFMQMCYILILYEFGQVEKDKSYLIFFLAILDVMPSYSYFMVKEDTSISDYLLDEAIELTDNRLGIIDESKMGAYPSYYVLENNIDYIQGWAIQGAATSSNLINLTEAMEGGYYEYGFKNLLELGCDSILIKKDILYHHDEEYFMDSAEYYGYHLVDENENVYLFDSDVNYTFGTNFTYDNLSIGTSSLYVSYLYPSFEQGKSNNLNDYTLEELCQYKNIYLSNFEFSSQEYLEDTLKQLSDAGVKVFIDTTNLPINTLSISEVLGVESRFIDLEESGYINYEGKDYSLDLPYDWYATYLYTEDTDIDLYAYNYGEEKIGYMAKRDNICFIGLNLPYLYIENHQEDLKAFLDTLFDADGKVVYETVPINIEYESKAITVTSDEKVHTSIAYQDNFSSDKELTNDNNLLTVDAGTTRINIFYKDFYEGLILSLIGIAVTIILERTLIRCKKEESTSL
jgi:uncharacterized membrane protein